MGRCAGRAGSRPRSIEPEIALISSVNLAARLLSCCHMSVSLYQRDYAYCLHRAAECLGGPVRALLLSFEFEQSLQKRVKPVARHGLGAERPMIELAPGRPRGAVAAGIELFRLVMADRTVVLAHVVLPGCTEVSVPDFWAVPTRDYALVCRYIRRLSLRAGATQAPLMDREELNRLWDNTVGFLTSGRETFERYRIPKKRGVLLAGSPGNGKTMACRWLLRACQQRGLRWRNVTASHYCHAKNRIGSVSYSISIGQASCCSTTSILAFATAAYPVPPPTTAPSLLSWTEYRAGAAIVYLFTTNARMRRSRSRVSAARPDRFGDRVFVVRQQLCERA